MRVPLSRAVRNENPGQYENPGQKETKCAAYRNSFVPHVFFYAAVYHYGAKFNPYPFRVAI